MPRTRLRKNDEIFERQRPLVEFFTDVDAAKEEYFKIAQHDARHRVTDEEFELLELMIKEAHDRMRPTLAMITYLSEAIDNRQK